MTGIGVFLASIGIADLVMGGLTGEPLRPRLGFVSALMASVVLGVAFGLDLAGIPSLVIMVATAQPFWAGFRQRSTRRGAWLALGWLAVWIVGAVLISDVWAVTDRPWSPVLSYAAPALRLGLGPNSENLALILGVLVFNAASGNAIVRSLLTSTGTEVEKSEERLRGGRLIGILERYLVFGLAVAGEPTAAALVVSAKSLLRFPELSKIAAETDARVVTADVDVVTEYFLLGSLASWCVALVFVPLTRLP